MGYFRQLFGFNSDENQKKDKFKETEATFSGSPEMVTFVKASWLTSRGYFYGKKQNYVKAIRDFQEAISIKNDYSPAYIGLGTCLRETGKLNEALNLLLKAPLETQMGSGEIFDSEFDILNQLTAVYMLMGDKAKFVETAKKTIEAAKNPKRKEQTHLAVECGVVDAQAISDDEIVALLQEMLNQVNNEDFR